jgi:ABC-type Zn uptake system ZnuABC Zn-binding protein ZnuA
MQGGNLANTVVPRILVVFEGLLGYLSADRVGDFNRAGSAGDWAGALALWDLSPLALAKLNDLIIRRDIKVEVVTFTMPPEGAQALAELFDEESVPVSRVLSSTPERTARRLAYGIDIIRVYCPDPRHALMCGSKGYHATSIHQLGR